MLISGWLSGPSAGVVNNLVIFLGSKEENMKRVLTRGEAGVN